MPGPRQRAPRLEPEARRRQLLDSALAVVDDAGFAGLTVDAVAKRAGVTRPVVYDLFGSYAGMLDALVEDAEVRALAAVGDALPDLSGDPDPAAVLEAAVATFLQAAQAQPALWRLLLAPAEGTPAEVRQRYRDQRALVVEHVAGLLDWWVAQVDALDGVDRHVLARTMVAVIEDAARLTLQHPRKHPPEQLAGAAAAVARLVAVDR